MTLRLVLTGMAKSLGQPRPRHGRKIARRPVGGDYENISKLLTKCVRISDMSRSAALWLAPWAAYEYPGRGRILRAATGRAVTGEAINHWQAGRYNLPVWAALAWAGVIEARAQTGLRIAAELRAYAVEPRDPPRSGWNLRSLRADGVGPGGLGARGRRMAAANNSAAPEKPLDNSGTP